MKHLLTSITLMVAGIFALISLSHAGTINRAFTDLNGEPQSIESFIGKGQWLVVMIWAHDCHVCNMEVEQYAQFHFDNEDKNIAVLGLSIDGQTQIKQAVDFVNRHDLPFSSLIGEQRAVMQYFRTETGMNFVGTPSFIIYNPEGKLMAAQSGAVPPEVIENFIANNGARMQ